jgi:hypothetical protein
LTLAELGKKPGELFYRLLRAYHSREHIVVDYRIFLVQDSVGEQRFTSPHRIGK